MHKNLKKFDSKLRGDMLIGYRGRCRCCGNEQMVFYYATRSPRIRELMRTNQFKISNCEGCAALKQQFNTVPVSMMPKDWSNYYLARLLEGGKIDFEGAEKYLKKEALNEQIHQAREAYVAERIDLAKRGIKTIALR